MSDRKPFSLWISFASVLALLVTVITSPIRSGGIFVVSTRPDCLRRNFGLPPNPMTRIYGKAINSPTLEIKALLCENEEQKVIGISIPVICSLDLPHSTPKMHAENLADLGQTQACYPLRC